MNTVCPKSRIGGSITFEWLGIFKNQELANVKKSVIIMTHEIKEKEISNTCIFRK